MTKKWISINILLLAAAIALGWQLYQAVIRYQQESTAANLRAQPIKKKSSQESGELPPRTEPKVNEAEYSAIPAQNLFAEIRRTEDKEVAVPVPEPPRKLDIIPVLVGITVFGNQRTALIRDPASPNVQGSRSVQTMHIGDNYRGFMVTDITEKNLILEYGASREVIPLYDTSKTPGQSGKTPNLPTRVVSFSPGAQGAVVGNASAPRAAQAANMLQPQTAGGTGAARTAPSAASNRPQASGTAAGGLQPVATGSVTAVAPGPTWNTQIDSQGRTIVNSPMGQFVVPATQTTQPTKK
jgi:hypothetical protein